MYDVLIFILFNEYNKSISYLLCNNGIRVNLYKLYFLSSYFFLTKQKSFSLSHFSILPTKHIQGKTKFFLPSHFSTPPTKRTLKEEIQNNDYHQRPKREFFILKTLPKTPILLLESMFRPVQDSSWNDMERGFFALVEASEWNTSEILGIKFKTLTQSALLAY